MSPFCSDSDGNLTPCQDGHTGAKPAFNPFDHLEDTTMADFNKPEAAARGGSHDQNVVVETRGSGYSTLDYHPQTLFLSGIATFLIIAILAMCICCAKKVHRLIRPFNPIHHPSARPNIYAQPRGGQI